MVKKSEPGVSRSERISDVGLDRLEKQLESGVNISSAVLAQWIKRYGDSARRIIKKHHCYKEAFDRIK
ncbi:MAG: hypothetical protein HKP12_11480 [Gammaproteobacteria bacterium]|nr:hypothetical protein [Gammaproteobacteria bacterium]